MECRSELNLDNPTYFNESLLHFIQQIRLQTAKSGRRKSHTMNPVHHLTGPMIPLDMMQRSLLSPDRVRVKQAYNPNRIEQNLVKTWMYRKIKRKAQEIARKQMPLAKDYLMGRIQKSGRQNISRLTKNHPLAVRLVDDALYIIPFGVKLHNYLWNHRSNVLETGFHLLKELHNFKEIDKGRSS